MVAQRDQAVARGGRRESGNRRPLLYAATILLLLMLALSLSGQFIDLQPVALFGLPMTIVGVTVLVLVLLYLAGPPTQAAAADGAQRAVRAALLPAVAVDTETGRIRAANEEALTLFGRDHVTPGASFIDLLSADAREDCRQIFATVSESGEAQVGTCAARTAADELRIVRLLARLHDGDGGSFAVVGFDSTEANEAVASFARIQERLMSNISHELRTPLNVVMGFSELLTTGTLGEMPENQLDAAEECHEGGERILRLINDILDVGRVRSYYVPGEKRPISPVEMIRRVENLLAGQARRQNLQLALDVEPGLEPIVVEERTFKQLAYHLILNSMNRSSAGGVVRVAARQEGDDLLLTISDTGVEMRGAIPPEALPELPEGYSETALAPPLLGLPLCSYLAGRVGGTLSAETDDEGVHFAVRLPHERG